jgi:hypothetical protein
MQPYNATIEVSTNKTKRIVSIGVEKFKKFAQKFQL